MGDYERIRLVTLGGSSVGKSAIVKRFLHQTFSEKYRPTVEDLYNQEYDFGHITLKVDILDTAGDSQFPAMRRLSIATAQAFLLVYSVGSSSSFDLLKICFEEIREQRSDYQDIPIIIAGNKTDAGCFEVSPGDVQEWLSTLPKLRVKVLECSAKEDPNSVSRLFRSFLQLSKIPIQSDDGGLKRRASAYVSKSRNGSPGHTTPPGGKELPAIQPPKSQFLTTEDTSSSGSKAKPRSRSLIRRSSRKAKQQVRDASVGGPTDCNIN